MALGDLVAATTVPLALAVVVAVTLSVFVVGLDFNPMTSRMDFNGLSTNDFDKSLTTLSGLIADTAHSPTARQQVDTAGLVMLIVPDVTRSNDVRYLRLLRGCVILLRNICVEPREVAMDVVVDALKAAQGLPPTEVGDKLITAYYEVIANMSCWCRDVRRIAGIEAVNLPFSVALLNMMDDDGVEAVLGSNQPVVEFLFRAVLNQPTATHSTATVSSATVSTATGPATPAQTTANQSATESNFTTIVVKLITHSSFGGYMDRHRQCHELILQKCQLLLPAMEWDNYQIVAILVWLTAVFVSQSGNVMKCIESRTTLTPHHLGLLMSLDCLSELAKFHAAIEFIVKYNVVQDLVSLLKAVHEYIEPYNLTKPKPTNPHVSFPHIKSIIIEILSYLVYDNFQVQEYLRTLGALHVILSCCGIDDDNPFIKERAIMCLKFLLKGNVENQHLVGALEAKNVVNPEVLEELGGEVHVKDGNIKLKASIDT